VKELEPWVHTIISPRPSPLLLPCRLASKNHWFNDELLHKRDSILPKILSLRNGGSTKTPRAASWRSFTTDGLPWRPLFVQLILSIYRSSPSNSRFFKMAAPNSAELSNILCLFRLLRTTSCADPSSILAWNKEFEFTPPERRKDPKPPWAGTLNLNSRRDPIYALRFSEKPKKDGSWVFGSLDDSRNDGFRGRVPAGKDQSRCDFQLSPSHIRSNISKAYFAIELAPRVWPGAPVIPRLKCLKGLVVVNYVKNPDYFVLLNPGDELLLG